MVPKSECFEGFISSLVTEKHSTLKHCLKILTPIAIMKERFIVKFQP